jgi:hypothetical protein
MCDEFGRFIFALSEKPKSCAFPLLSYRPRTRQPHLPPQLPRATHHANHRPYPTAMSSHAVCGVETRARKRKRERDTNPQEAFPGLPQDVVVTHILRSDTDPIVLARLKAVSRAMRDAVERTGLRVEEMTTERAAHFGCLDTLQHKLQKGRLDKSKVCKLAALFGQLEVLQWARANGCTWDMLTCRYAAHEGYLEVLQWARANGCPWDEHTCSYAAKCGQLGVLQWARANGCPWDWVQWMSKASENGHLDVQAWLNENQAVPVP